MILESDLENLKLRINKDDLEYMAEGLELKLDEIRKVVGSTTTDLELAHKYELERDGVLETLGKIREFIKLYNEKYERVQKSRRDYLNQFESDLDRRIRNNPDLDN